MTLRTRDTEIFMNGKKWRMREGGGGGLRRWGLLLVTRAMSGLIYIKRRLIGCGATLALFYPVNLFIRSLPAACLRRRGGVVQ